MSKKSILTIVFIMLLSIGIVSLYSTFAYNEEATKLDDSTADYNLIYSMRESTKNQVIVSPGETKFVDITLTNNYNSNVKYGMYYHLVSPNKLPDEASISLSSDSKDSLEDIIKPGQEKIVTIKITNNSQDNVDIVVGALVGFENGDIQELIKEGEYLIK